MLCLVDDWHVVLSVASRLVARREVALLLVVSVGVLYLLVEAAVVQQEHASQVFHVHGLVLRDMYLHVLEQTVDEVQKVEVRRVVVACLVVAAVGGGLSVCLPCGVAASRHLLAVLVHLQRVADVDVAERVFLCAVIRHLHVRIVHACWAARAVEHRAVALHQLRPPLHVLCLAAQPSERPVMVGVPQVPRPSISVRRIPEGCELRVLQRERLQAVERELYCQVVDIRHPLAVQRDAYHHVVADAHLACADALDHLLEGLLPALEAHVDVAFAVHLRLVVEPEVAQVERHAVHPQARAPSVQLVVQP